MSDGRIVAVSHEEGITAAELICMVIRGEVIRSENSLAAVRKAVKTIIDYNDCEAAWRRAIRQEPAA